MQKIYNHDGNSIEKSNPISKMFKKDPDKQSESIRISSKDTVYRICKRVKHTRRLSVNRITTDHIFRKGDLIRFKTSKLTGEPTVTLLDEDLNEIGELLISFTYYTYLKNFVKESISHN